MSADDKRWEKYAQGCILSSEEERWERTAPTPTSDASTSTTNWRVGSGAIRMGAETKRLLRLVKQPQLPQTTWTPSWWRSRQSEERLVGWNCEWNACRIGEPQKPLQGLTGIWGWPVHHSLNLVGIHAHPLGRDDVTQKCYWLCMKFAFLRLDKKPILEQPLEHPPDVLNMFLERRRKYQYVIQVDNIWIDLPCLSARHWRVLETPRGSWIARRA